MNKRQTLAEFFAEMQAEVYEAEAREFQRWVDDRGLDLECPDEWLSAWIDYVEEDEPIDFGDDGQPDEQQEWNDYDSYC